MNINLILWLIVFVEIGLFWGVIRVIVYGMIIIYFCGYDWGLLCVLCEESFRL